MFSPVFHFYFGLLSVIDFSKLTWPCNRDKNNTKPLSDRNDKNVDAAA